MHDTRSQSGKPQMERLDLALMVVLAGCMVLAAIVVGGLQTRATQSAAGTPSFVAR
ncbi:MAG: hypothetical protein MUF14_02295 [Hyphomonadaceae bacterium]|jgi:hypothetical protein|nr:hypothetical protein [Hyphomonadaceae bacterium]